ncbi:hypothetical protein [Pseudomonas caricapapayae]|nr:hypothetical protein [Pseudomonas caricapapayae]KAA8694640.1 hypothetical protein F4W67_14865 [Pseudomonas caricapapayae]
MSEIVGVDDEGRAVWTLTKDGQLRINASFASKHALTTPLKSDKPSREAYHEQAIKNAWPADGTANEKLECITRALADCALQKATSPQIAEQALCDALVELVRGRGHCDGIVADATSIAAALVAGLKVISESGNTP